MKSARFLVLVCLSACPAPALAAQRLGAAIEGTVKDETGAALADAAVSAHNRLTGLERRTTTDREGRFVVAGLPADGQYDVRVDRSGFAAAIRPGVILLADDTVAIDLILRVSAEDSLLVTAEPAPIIDRSEIRQTIGETLVRTLPLSGRGFLDLVSLAAGFTGNADYPNPQGQWPWANNVFVDGASDFSKWRSAARTFYSGYNLESIKSVRVFTNRFSAEYGGALASVTTAVTKAGTNEWHGSALLYVRDDALDSVPVFAVRKPSSSAQQYGLSLGGPLMADRTHIFASYEGRRDRNRNIVVSPAAPNAEVPDDQDEHLAFIRLDHQRGDRALVTARYNGQRLRWHHEPGGLALPGTGTRFVNDVQTALLTDTMSISSRTLNDLRIQFARYVDVRQDLQPSMFVSRLGYSIEGGLLGPGGFGASPEDTWEVADTVSRWIGPHALEIGAGAMHVRTRATSFTHGRGAYYFAGEPALYPDPYLFVQSLAPAGATIVKPRSVSAFGFLQDDWRIRPGVTLNLGVRYDVERVSHVSGYDVPVDGDNVQPRMGFAWDPDGSGRTIIRGGAGVYTQQQLFYPIDRAQSEGPNGAALVSVAPGSPLMPVFPDTFATDDIAVPRDVYRVSPSFQNPYSLQSTLGVRRLVRGNVVAVDYVDLRGRALASLIDANAPASIEALAHRSVEQADATRPSSTYRKVITLGNEGRSWYRALQVTMERSAGSWQGVGSYTLSRAEDMANYELPQDSRNIAAERGRASTDVTHNLALGMVWQLPGSSSVARGWSLSGIGFVRSGRSYTITWGDDRNGTTQNDARPGARNTARTPAFHNIDLAMTKRFHRSGVSYDARVEAFNLLDITNYDQYVGALLSPMFGRPVSAFPRRRIQLAGTVRF